MMTLAPIRSAVHAATYFEHSDHANYYLAGDVGPSVWLGGGAEHLGINGQQVDSERFRRYLGGEIAGQNIGTFRNDQWEHKPGWDLQFSPPKSVSIVALVGGDLRVIEAHDRAVKEAICLLEKKAAYTRVHRRAENGTDIFEQQATGNILAAVFRHDTSRALDPQLHSHAVVLNATRRADGGWRSLESRHFYTLQKEAGLVYRLSFAASLRELGYSLVRAEDANFEIAGVSKELLVAFSQRRNAIDQKLAELGFSRETAPVGLKEQVAHEGRANKVSIDRNDLAGDWQEVASQYGFDAKDFVTSAVMQCAAPGWTFDVKTEDRDRLGRLVMQVIDSLSERESIISRPALEYEIQRIAVGYGIPLAQLAGSLEWAKEQGMLVGGRFTKIYSAQFQCWQEVEAFTTPENLELERRMIEILRSGRFAMMSAFTLYESERLIQSAERVSRLNGYGDWTAGQKSAVRGVLTTSDQFIAIQGYAGTAKTSTALRTIAAAYENRGYHVTGMAPSSSACESLSSGARIDRVLTVASHLLKAHENGVDQHKQLWLVDEASLLATKDMSRLLDCARRQQAKVVLVGDVKQLGSVDAGAAFRQLQDNGIVTYQLDEIVRQENKHVLESVLHSLNGDAERALAVLADGGGAVVEVSGDAGSRHKKIVEQYLELTQAQREATLVIDPSREGRDQLNQRLREGLRDIGEVSQKEIDTLRLESIDLTKASAQDVLNYRPGDVIRFNRVYKNQRIDKHSYWSIGDVDQINGVICLVGSDGRSVVWNPAAWGAKSQAFRKVESGLSIGDKIIWTINDRPLGLTNGAKAIVEAVNLEHGTADIRFSSGVHHTIDLHDPDCQHWNYDYVSTVHSAQGKTADRVIFHAESFRRNLSSQKALYVAISRAKEEVTIYTDSKDRLIEQINEHVGEKQPAMDRRGEEYEL